MLRFGSGRLQEMFGKSIERGIDSVICDPFGSDILCNLDATQLTESTELILPGGWVVHARLATRVSTGNWLAGCRVREAIGAGAICGEFGTGGGLMTWMAECGRRTLPGPRNLIPVARHRRWAHRRVLGCHLGEARCRSVSPMTASTALGSTRHRSFDRAGSAEPRFGGPWCGQGNGW